MSTLRVNGQIVADVAHIQIEPEPRDEGPSMMAPMFAIQLDALTLANDLRADYAGHVPWNRAIQGDLAAIERAIYPARTARDECHHCGAPSPGSICRYCNTVHRRTTT